MAVATKPDAQSLSPKSCHDALRAGDILLFDVRRETVFRAADTMAQSAQWRDPAHLAEWAPRLRTKRKIAVYCVHGHEVSQNAAAGLRQAGYEAFFVEGGIEGWQAAGLPVVSRHKPVPGATYVTRARPKIDRVAVPWLIRRFVDETARFAYVAPDQVLANAAESGAIPYDVPYVELSHSGEFCSFDACIAKFRIEAPGLARVARIVRGADTGRHDLAPEAAGLLAASLGFSCLYKDDLAMLAAIMPLYDALLAWAREAAEETHSWQPSKI